MSSWQLYRIRDSRRAGQEGGEVLVERAKMAELKQFVSDQLHSLLGMSESNLVDYVIALAKRSRNEPALLEALQVRRPGGNPGAER